MKLNRQQWILFRAEQLAQRKDPETFQKLYLERSLAFGFEGYDAANISFRGFLQPYVNEARDAYEAEHAAAYKHGVQYAAGWNAPKAAIPVHEVQDVTPEDEEDQEDESCQMCGTLIDNGEQLCDECQAEEDAEDAVASGEKLPF